MRAKVAIILVAAISLAAIPPVGGAPIVPRVGDAVSRNEIRIGLHAPLTGAAPIPSESADQGARVYWKWLRQRNNKINGRYVDAVLKNDNYNPSQAVAVCKEMVERDHVFLISGLVQPEGTAQIQACARYADSVGVPYVSFGSTKRGLKRLRRYFAISKSAPGQARMLADLLVSDQGARNERNGIVRHDTPFNEETHDAFVRRLRRRDAELHYDRAVSRNSGQTEAEVVVQEMEAAGIENVFILSSPVWFLQLLQAAEDEDFRPLWVGIQGIPMAGDVVASVGCRNGSPGRSRFLSPVPAFANRDSFDRRHDRAMRRVYGERGDSITWLGWAGSRALRKMLERAGRDLSRRHFERRVEQSGTFRTGIIPPFRFTPKDHFAGRKTHVLKIDCETRRWTTKRRFVSDF